MQISASPVSYTHLDVYKRQAHVTLAEFFKPEPNPLTGQDGLFQLFFQNAGVQGFFPGFQFVQPLLGGRGQDALFNGCLLYTSRCV